MALTVPAVGDLWTATLADAVINYVNAANTVVNFVPAGNTDTPASGTTPTTWITLGNLAVPSWATAAVVVMTVNGFYEVAAGSDNVTIKTGIGTALGPFAPRLIGAPSANRGSFTWADTITSPPTGSQSLIVQATRVTGTSVYRVDGSCSISAQVSFLM